MKDFYRAAIMEAIEACEDIGLLDLVWKMFQESATAPTPAGPTLLEVRKNADNTRDPRQHWAVPSQICNSATHPGPIHSKVGNRREDLPRVCGGVDSLPRAA